MRFFPDPAQTDANEMKDGLGVTFDPEVHQANADGVPVRNKDGSFRALPGKGAEAKALKEAASNE